MKTATSPAVEPLAAQASAPEFESHLFHGAPQAILIKSILVPLDFSEMSMKSLDYAVPFARQYDAKITLVHIVPLKGYSPALPDPAPLGAEHHAEVVAQLERVRQDRVPSELQGEVMVRHNFVFDGIMEAVREAGADLIITTTHGHTGLKHMMLGSTAESIVRQAPCPVLVVR